MTQQRTTSEDDDAIVAFVKEWQSSAWGYGPSKRDVSSGTGVSLGTTHRRVKALREAGRLVYQDHVARSIAIPR